MNRRRCPRPTQGIPVAIGRHEQHVGVEGQSRHAEDGIGDVPDVHQGLGQPSPVGLRGARSDARGEFGESRLAGADPALRAILPGAAQEV